MDALRRGATAAGYAFAAWLCAALLIYGATATASLTGPWSVPVRCAGLSLTFGPVFSLYFRRRRPLAPAAAAALAVALIALLDLALVARHFSHPYALYLRFWDWQLPAAFVAGSVYAAGRRAPSSAAQKIL